MASKVAPANDPSQGPTVSPDLKDIDKRLSNELVIALVGPVASGCTAVYEAMATDLENNYDYDPVYVRLSDLIKDHAAEIGISIPDDISVTERIDRFQTAGNELRARFGDAYLVDRAIERIAVERDQRGGYTQVGDRRIVLPHRRAYFLDSLKNPAELRRLRQVYGDLLWVITVFAPDDVRFERLRRKGMIDEDARHAMQRDYEEEAKSGQNVSRTAHQANYFIRNATDNKDDLEAPVGRFLRTIFGVNLHTPTQDEKGMMEAASAAVRSACLSRQVGAAIYDPDGDLLGVGCNDVPKFGGGLYNEDSTDHRCFRWQSNECHNDKQKSLLASRIAKAAGGSGQQAVELVTDAMEGGVANLIEFSRSVHAEMEAIVSVARSGNGSTIGSTLYTTTFPCHSCARHIVAAGISTVFYVEPYSKSLALELHSDSISLHEDCPDKVRFLQYAGFAPRTSLRLFSSAGRDRKRSGKYITTLRQSARPVFASPLDSYTTSENLIIQQLNAEGTDNGTAA